MLRACAPGHTIRRTKHSQVVTYNGKTSRLPLGSQGKQTNSTEIESGHIRQLVRHFGILEVAKEHLPEIF